MSKYAVVRATSRSVVFTCDAASIEDATAQAVIALSKTSAPLSWHVLPAADLPEDLAVEAASWTPDVE